MIEFNLPKMYDFVQQIDIENKIYHMRLTLNDSKDYWSISLYDELMEPIVEMIRLVPDFELFYNIVDYRLPKGVFGCVTDKEWVGADSLFNGDAQLVYFEREEFDALLEVDDG